jgi:hypothetical protein
VSQDNVIKMARQVKVFAPPARGSRGVCCNTGFVCLIGGEFWQVTMPAGSLPGRGHSPRMACGSEIRTPYLASARWLLLVQFRLPEDGRRERACRAC